MLFLHSYIKQSERGGGSGLTNWETVRNEYESSDISMKDLAEKHDVKPSTLRSRKNREGWARGHPDKVEKKSVATQRNEKENVATRKVIEDLNNSDLTEQRKQFCLLYLQYFNATKAYKEAYGCDYRTANAHGYKLLSNVVIREELDRLKEAQRQELYIDSLDIKKNWVKQAFADMNDFVVFGKREVEVMGMFGPVLDDKGNVLMKEVNYVDFKESIELDGTLIKEVKMGKDGPVVQLHDKQKAMQELMKFLIDKDPDEDMDDGFIQALEHEAGDVWES